MGAGIHPWCPSVHGHSVPSSWGNCQVVPELCQGSLEPLEWGWCLPREFGMWVLLPGMKLLTPIPPKAQGETGMDWRSSCHKMGLTGRRLGSQRGILSVQGCVHGSSAGNSNTIFRRTSRGRKPPECCPENLGDSQWISVPPCPGVPAELQWLMPPHRAPRACSSAPQLLRH